MKKSAEESQPAASRSAKLTHSSHTRPSREKGFWREFFTSIVAHTVAPVVLAGASVAWLYFARDPSVPQWPFLIFVVLTIVLVYLSLISLRFFFPNDLRLSHRKSLHLALLAILVVTVTAPLAMVLSYMNAQGTNQKRLIRLYKQVTDTMKTVLEKESINSDDFQDLLASCLTSIRLNQPQYEFRATVEYLDKSGNNLVVPKKGYYGFDRSMECLYFNVADRKDETDEERRTRIGVAGYSFLHKDEIIDLNVQISAGKPYTYKQFPGSSKDQPDAAMICVPIYDLSGGKVKRVIGVLSVSSITAGVLHENDLAVARFYATLLGKFKTASEIPPGCP